MVALPGSWTRPRTPPRYDCANAPVVIVDRKAAAKIIPRENPLIMHPLKIWLSKSSLTLKPGARYGREESRLGNGRGAGLQNPRTRQPDSLIGDQTSTGGNLNQSIITTKLLRRVPFENLPDGKIRVVRVLTAAMRIAKK